MASLLNVTTGVNIIPELSVVSNVVPVIVMPSIVLNVPPVTDIFQVTVIVVPSNVKLDESSNSPAVPASTMRPLVKSSTLALANIA